MISRCLRVLGVSSFCFFFSGVASARWERIECAQPLDGRSLTIVGSNDDYPVPMWRVDLQTSTSEPVMTSFQMECHVGQHDSFVATCFAGRPADSDFGMLFVKHVVETYVSGTLLPEMVRDNIEVRYDPSPSGQNPTTLAMAFFPSDCRYETGP